MTEMISFSENNAEFTELNPKILRYIWDLGIRNAVIGDFAQLENRMDAGPLWENFAIAERMKLNAYGEKLTQSWFWRTQRQNEIDYVEEFLL